MGCGNFLKNQSGLFIGEKEISLSSGGSQNRPEYHIMEKSVPSGTPRVLVHLANYVSIIFFSYHLLEYL